jgi:pimeloyl-ACP methyl ester carboxylesterase
VLAGQFHSFLNAQGYDCYALDLSGHGASSGHEQLDEFGLADYTDDLTQAVAELPALPVLIGHSMGTLVAQRYLIDGKAAGVALLSPVPPTGTGGTASRLALTNPAFRGIAQRDFRHPDHAHAAGDGPGVFLAGHASRTPCSSCR